MEELDLKELFEIFWSKKLTIAICVIIFAILGLIYSYMYVTPKYKSETSLLIVKQDTNTSDTSTLTSTDLTLNQKLAATYSELIKSKSVMRRVINNLNLSMTEDQLKSSITVSAKANTEMIVISVVNNEPSNAKIIANEVVTAFTEQIKEIYNIDNVNVVDEAEISTTPYNINHPKDIVIFMLMGAVVAIAYVLIANMIDTTIKGKDEVEKDTKLIVLTEIPLCDFNETKLVKKGGRR